jgi:hypothetical protein
MKIKISDLQKHIQQEVKKLLKEDFDDDNLGTWSDFDYDPTIMNSAKNAAMSDMKKDNMHHTEAAGDIGVEDIIQQLEMSKVTASGHELSHIQKQLDHLKRFGGGSINENLNELVDTKQHFYIIEDGGTKKFFREDNVEDIPNVYFASGVREDSDTKPGDGFVHYKNALYPLYDSEGQRISKPEWAGKDYWDLKKEKEQPQPLPDELKHLGKTPLMGAMQNGKPQPTEYVLVSLDGDEAVVKDTTDGAMEVYYKSPHFAGYHLIINNEDYEFAHEYKPKNELNEFTSAPNVEIKNGYTIVSDIIDGYGVHRKYQGYSKKEAIAKFKAETKNKKKLDEYYHDGFNPNDDSNHNSATKYYYHINLDERGIFEADVREHDIKTIWTTEGDVFEDGYMKDKHDMIGLKDYLIELGLIDEDDILIDTEIDDNYLHENELEGSNDELSGIDKNVSFVVDNGFNRANAKDLIGLSFEIPPSYTAVDDIKASEAPGKIYKNVAEFRNETSTLDENDSKKPLPQKGTPEWHELQIARKTLKMSDIGAEMMGGQTKEHARKVFAKYGLKIPVDEHVSENKYSDKIVRPKDAKGQDIGLKTRVKDLATGSFGRVTTFGDKDGRLTVHVAWVGKFGAEIPSSVKFPNEIEVADPNTTTENTSRDLAVGHGENLKPSNYPKSLMAENQIRQSIRKILKEHEGLSTKTTQDLINMDWDELYDLAKTEPYKNKIKHLLVQIFKDKHVKGLVGDYYYWADGSNGVINFSNFNHFINDIGCKCFADKPELILNGDVDGMKKYILYSYASSDNLTNKNYYEKYKNHIFNPNDEFSW